MKSLFLLISLISLPFIGHSQQTLNKSISHNGITRTFILYVPANYTGNTAVPLVFNFHGYTSDANAQMWYGDFRPIADTAGFIIAHPQGTLFNGNTHFNVGGWTVGSTADDVGFTAAMIDSLSAQYNIDADRIYSTGMSNGGYMSFLLACQLSDKIAAVASVTGSMTPQTYNACDPKHPTPIIQIHGTQDGTVPYNGDTWTKSIQEVVQYWISHNNCDTIAVTTDLPDANTSDGSTVQQIVYEGGDNLATTEHFKVTGGDHTWPGASFGGAGTNQDFNASLTIWKFFSRYTLSGLSSTTAIDPLENPLKIKLYPNPAKSYIKIQTESTLELDYIIRTIAGQTLLSGTIHSGLQQIDIAHLPQGIYLIQIGSHMFKLLKMD